MKVKEVIEYLQRVNPEDEIGIAMNRSIFQEVKKIDVFWGSKTDGSNVTFHVFRDGKEPKRTKFSLMLSQIRVESDKSLRDMCIDLGMPPHALSGIEGCRYFIVEAIGKEIVNSAKRVCKLSEQQEAELYAAMLEHLKEQYEE